jgi:hypothetical protein
MSEITDRLENLEDKFTALESRLGLLEIIAKKGGTQAEPVQEKKKIIQINAQGKKYFCANQEEQRIFEENKPGVKTESFEVELPVFVADRYLNDPENKKQFVKKVG